MSISSHIWGHICISVAAAKPHSSTKPMWWPLATSWWGWDWLQDYQTPTMGSAMWSPQETRLCVAYSMFNIFVKVSTLLSYYNVVNSLWSTHNRHPISCPLGHAMWCLLWVQVLIYVLSQSCQCNMKYHVVLAVLHQLRTTPSRDSKLEW